jgi:hypothetical protein
VADDIPNFEGRELTKSSREKRGRLRPMPFRIYSHGSRFDIFKDYRINYAKDPCYRGGARFNRKCLCLHSQFVWADPEQTWRQGILLHLGIFALAVPYIVVERMKANGQQFSYGGVAPYEGRPIWVKRSMGIVFAFFITFFLIFLIQGHAASREIIDGEYVLNNHGTIVRYLSANEYFQMKASELCLFASGWMANYGLMMYWWFPRPIAETPWTLDP